jgi:hypothetical protein
LNAKVKEHGWRCLGMWIAANPVGKQMQKYDRSTWEPYFRECLQWPHAAGIGIWKVDWGVAGPKYRPFRQWLTDLARTEAPQLIVETAACGGPLFEGRECLEREAFPMLAWGDLYRTYDALLGTATTLMRSAELLRAPAPTAPAKGLLNIESQYYLGAGLGCTFGAMGHPQFNPGAEILVVRALRWQRVAPAWAVGDGVAVSREMLRQTLMPKGPIKNQWWGHEALRQQRVTADGQVFEEAPAVVVRGMPLDAITVTPGAP